jgi:hypothetical protein
MRRASTCTYECDVIACKNNLSLRPVIARENNLVTLLQRAIEPSFRLVTWDDQAMPRPRVSRSVTVLDTKGVRKFVFALKKIDDAATQEQ